MANQKDKTKGGFLVETSNNKNFEDDRYRMTRMWKTKKHSLLLQIQSQKFLMSMAVAVGPTLFCY